MTVHLAASTENFHCMVDGELFLPETWSDDRERCREAGIPDDMVYRPKWQIALELYDRSVAEGVKFPWITADAELGKSEFAFAPMLETVPASTALTSAGARNQTRDPTTAR